MPTPESAGVHAAVAAYGSVSTAYEAGRPGYPSEAIVWLATEAGIGPGRDVLDLAAGTGKLTTLLCETGAGVIAVEPVASFRETLTRLPVDVRDGTAERIPLADDAVDAVTVGSAFHWFDAPRALDEIVRILRPGGALAVLWNERDQRDATQRALTALLEPYRRDEPRQADESWLAALDRETRFGPLHKRNFVHQHPFTADTLVERVKSISFVADLAGDVRASLLGEVRELAHARLREHGGASGGTFELPHVTHAYLTRLGERCGLLRRLALGPDDVGGVGDVAEDDVVD